MGTPLEDVKGRAKEPAGAVTDSASLKREGEAQQRKSAAQEEAVRHEEKAGSARADAARAESAEARNQ